MRDISDAILSAQRADSCTPATVLTVGVTDYSDRIKQLRHMERPWGGTATILLDNSDKGIVTDLRGKKVNISYGFTAGVSKSAPLWVLTPRDVSIEGLLAVQLECIDIWLKLSLLRIISGGGVQLDGTITGFFVPGMKVTGQTSGATGTVVYVGEGYIAVGNVAKTFSVGETVQSDVYSDSQIVVSAVADFGGGSAPAWNGDKTILEIIQQLTSGVVEVVLDSSDGIVDIDKPTYETEVNTPVVDIIQDMMNRTTSAIRMGNDEKLHIFPITDTLKYSYDSDHAFLSDLRDVSSILPNRIIVFNALEGAAGLTTYTGSAQDDDAFARFGIWITQVVLANAQNNAEADAIALLRLWRIQREATRGRIEVPIMNVGQELFDYIRVTDTRAGIDYYGWVGSVEHIQAPGQYGLNVELGGLMGGERLPADAEYPLPNIDSPITPPPGQVVVPGRTVGAGEQAYIAVVKFTSVAHNEVSWTEGTIELSDGRTQTILADSLTLTATHYLYCIWGNSNLQSSTSYSDAVGPDRMLVAVASKAATSDQLAYVLNPFTDSIMINRDKVMDGLVNELKLADQAVSNAKIAVAAIQGAVIAAGAITETKVGTNAISTAKLQAAAITAAKIAAGAVIAEKIEAGAVTTSKLYAGAVTASKIQAAAVTAIKIDAAAVTADKIDAGAITAAKLAAEIVLATLIKAGEGDVVIGPDGITVTGEHLLFKYGATDVAVIHGQSWGLNLHSYPHGGRMKLGWEKSTGVQKTLLAYEDNFYPTPEASVSLGSSSFWYELVYASKYYGKLTEIYSFQDHDDIGLLRSIKAKNNNLQLDTFPLEVMESDKDVLRGLSVAIREHAENHDMTTEQVTAELAKMSPSKPDRAINILNWQSLLMGSVLQQADKIEELEKRIKELEG